MNDGLRSVLCYRHPSHAIMMNLLRKTSTPEQLISRRVGKHLMFLDPQDRGISAVLKKRRRGKTWQREPDFMEIIDEEVQPGMTVFDLGANIGYNTLILADRVGKTGRVYAVEPSPRNYYILVKNIEANGYADRVATFQTAIAQTNGSVKFYLSAASNLHSLFPSSLTTDAIDVPVVTTDHFFRDKPLPDFIRMDVEGGEVEVFQGMLDTARRAAPRMKILLEVHPAGYSQEHSLEKQLRRLFNVGFSAKYVVSAGTAYPDFFVERGYAPEKIYHEGNWSRGRYRDILFEDMLTAACHPHQQAVKRPWRNCVKRPWLAFNRSLSSPKIVRGLLLEKAEVDSLAKG